MDSGEKLGSQKIMATAVCDGNRMLQAYGPMGRADEAVPTISLAFRMTFARVGLAVAGSFCAEYPVSKDATTLDIPAMLTVSELKVGEDEANLKTLTYQVRVNKAFVRGIAEPVQIKTWYDPKSFNPVKRTVTTKVAGKEKTFVETYERVAFEEVIPDEKFKLPEEKK